MEFLVLSIIVSTFKLTKTQLGRILGWIQEGNVKPQTHTPFFKFSAV